MRRSKQPCTHPQPPLPAASHPTLTPPPAHQRQQKGRGRRREGHRGQAQGDQGHWRQARPESRRRPTEGRHGRQAHCARPSRATRRMSALVLGNDTTFTMTIVSLCIHCTPATALDASSLFYCRYPPDNRPFSQQHQLIRPMHSLMLQSCFVFVIIMASIFLARTFLVCRYTKLHGVWYPHRWALRDRGLTSPQTVPTSVYTFWPIRYTMQN